MALTPLCARGSDTSDTLEGGYREVSMLSDSKDNLVQRAPELLKKRPQSQDTASTIAAGSLVTWTRGDGTRPEGFVDFLHTDDTGIRWGFVSFGKTWAVVNLKFVKVLR